MLITKQVTFIAKQDKIEELKALLKTMVQASKDEKGCLFYEICQVNSQKEKFIVLESWENEASLDGHKISAHYKHYKANFEVFCADKNSLELETL
ncbi:MAG: antibiotic biosynthesis monooxygenase [Campylobacteraceae bacterium]|nr:antibiotic biosynthesis monooxygenase [Campylobacteraceae bacterium]